MGTTTLLLLIAHHPLTLAFVAALGIAVATATSALVQLRRAAYSGSALSRVSTCPPSAVLGGIAHVGTGELGSAIHEHLSMRLTHGMDAAVDAIPRIAEKWGLDERQAGIFRARCLSFEWTPPKGAFPEVALCMLEDGTVHPIEGGHGSYLVPETWLVPMTVDVFWSEPEPLRWEGDEKTGRPVCPEGSTLWVCDYKAGQERHVAPVESNGQALAGALLVARWTGAKSVVPALIYVRKGQGLWDTPPAALGPADLDRIEASLRVTRSRVREQQERLERGAPLDYVEGPHCTYCPAQTRCEAKVATLRAVIGSPAPTATTELAPEEATRLAVLQPQVSALAEAMKKVLKAHVVATGAPIDLGGGNVWGPNPHYTTDVDAMIGVEELAKEVGQDAAEAAVEMKLSRTAIENVVREAHAEKGIKRQLAPTVRAVMGRIGSRGGLVQKPETWWSSYRKTDDDPTAGLLKAEAEDRD